MFLVSDKRKKLVELTKKFLDEDFILDNNWEEWANSEEYLTEVEKEIIHLLLWSVKKGKVLFNKGQEDEDIKTMIALLKDFESDLHELKNIQEATKNDNLVNSGHMITMMSRRIKILIDSVHKDEEEIKDLIESEFGISEGAKLTVEDGLFKIEYHEKVRNTQYSETEFKIKDTEEPYLFVFDNDYLVAAIQGEMSGKIFTVQSFTKTFVRFKGYINRTIRLLFVREILERWISGINESTEAYSELRNDSFFLVSKKDGRFEITINGD